MKTSVSIFLLLFIYSLPIALSKTADKQPYFLENKGQITDQHKQPRKDIDFKLSANGVTLFVGNGQLHYQWIKNEKVKIQNSKDLAVDLAEQQETAVSIYRMDVTLIGANKNATLITEEITDYKENYYLPQCRDGATAKSYRKISYQNVYPNIDWVLYVKDEQVKYDFVVHQGGDVKNIKLRYNGATKLAIEDDGALIATTPYGSITEAAPISYIAETGKAITSQYILNDNELSYAITVDEEGTMVIDPGLLWSTYYGGTGYERGNDAAADRYGGVYLVGETNSTTNIATTGTHQSSLIGSTGDGYLAKFNDSGVRQWATYYGGAGNEYLLSVVVDNKGGVYAVGHTDSSTGLATTGAHQTTFNGPYIANSFGDVIMIKLNTSNGQRLWSTYYGGSSEEFYTDIAYDGVNHIYITGRSESPTHIASTGAYQDTVNTSGGHSNSYIAKFTLDGTRVWGTYYSDNNGAIELKNITCDYDGNVYVSGRALGINNTAATSGAHQTAIASSSNDCILAKFSSSGNRIWATFIGDEGSDFMEAITCDKAGNVYIAGETYYSNAYTLKNIVSATGYDTSFNGIKDAFLMKFSPTGTRLWGTYYGGTQQDIGWDINIGPSGKLYLLGATRSTSGIATTNGLQTSLIGNNVNLFLASFDTATGYPQWGTYFGRGGEGYPSREYNRSIGLATSPKGILYMAAITGKTGLATSNAHQQSLGGQQDGLLVALYIDTVAYIQEPYIDSVWCPLDTLRIPYGVNSTFASGNNFKIELSNATGSFATPVTIGTKASTVGDTIVCIVPLNTPSGNGYRIRISSTNPTYSYEEIPVNIKINATVQGFSNSSNTPICAGDTLQLNGTTTSTGVSWSWVGVGSFNSVAKDTFIANTTTAMSGDYVLTATLNSSGCSLKDTTTVLVKPLPAKPVASSNAPVCTGDTLRLTTSSSTSGVSYSWVGAGSYTSAMQNPTVSNNAVSTMSGNYISTVTLNGCSNKDTINVVVHPVTPAPTVSSNSPLCATQTLNLTASNITGASYNWFGVAGFTANTQNPSRANMTSGFAGTYYVYATLNGCLSDTTAHIVQVNPDPQVNVIPSPSTSICAGQTATFVALTSNAGATPSFQWLVNGIATGQTGTSYITNTLLNNDAVRCVMTSTGTCSSSFQDTSSAISMTVTPVLVPSVTIAANPSTPLDPNEPVMFTATPTNGGNNPTYQWTRNGTPISGAIGQTWGANANALSNNDDICVIMHSDYQCPNPDSAISNCIKVQINVGIDNVNNTNKLQLFPNPNKGTFTLQGETNGNKPIQLSIINSIGQTVYQSNIQPQNNTINQQIELNKELATGVYLLQLRSDEGISTVKLYIR